MDLHKAELQVLGLHHGTNKAHPTIGYLRFYEYLLQGFRQEDIEVIELGAGPVKTIGASFYMWRDYFSRAKIIGVDNKVEASSISDERIKIEIGDLGSEQFLGHLTTAYSPTIVIDDASHQWNHQIKAFEAIFPSLKSQGIYIVEDLHTSFSDDRTYYGNDIDEIDAFSYFSALNSLVCGRSQAHPLVAMLGASDRQIELANLIDMMVFGRRFVAIVKSKTAFQ